MTAQEILAFVAKRQATTALPASAWAHVLSLELGWASPSEARLFVGACRDAGLLRGEDPLRLGFDPGGLDLKGFRGGPLPMPADLPADPPEETLLSPKVAGLLARAEAGEDVRSEAAAWLKSA